MKKVVWILFLLIWVVFGCRSTKTITSSQQHETTATTSVVNQSDSSVSISVSSGEYVDINNTEETTQEDKDVVVESYSTDDLVINETITMYSVPDSAGNQYPVSVTNRQSTRVRQSGNKTADKSKTATSVKENNQTNATTADSASVSENNKTTVNKTSQQDTTSSTMTKEKKGGNLLWILLILLGVGVVVFLILKQYGGLTWVKRVIKQVIKFI